MDRDAIGGLVTGQPPTGTLTKPPRQTSAEDTMTRITMEKFMQAYEENNKLGEGGFGMVYGGTRLIDGVGVAIKYLRTNSIPRWFRQESGEQTPYEIHAMLKLKGIKGIIQIYDYAIGLEWTVITMESKLNTVELFTFLNKKGVLDDETSAKIVRGTAEAVKVCKENGIHHGDIKNENILVNKDTMEVTLIDFGAATSVDHKKIRTHHGTKEYAPPEWIQKGEYDGELASVWSIGVFAFELVDGSVPFESNRAICEDPLPRTNSLNEDSHDLIRRCLEKDESRRFSLEAILQHKWLDRGAHNTTGSVPGEPFDTELQPPSATTQLRVGLPTARTRHQQEKDLGSVTEQRPPGVSLAGAAKGKGVPTNADSRGCNETKNKRVFSNNQANEPYVSPVLSETFPSNCGRPRDRTLTGDH